LEKIYRAEEELAIGIYRLAKSSIKISGDLIMGALDSLSGLSNGQMKAVKRVFSSGVSVITGGPGTGKTTTLKSLIKVFEKLKLTFVLASPTGRAAKRLSEATGRHASTVHRLLEFSPMGDFQKNRDNPLKYDAVIIDEASMLDLFLADSLVKALKAGTLFVLVGDINQLPSVGPGSVLKDIIASEIGTTSILDEIFRQAGESMIVVNAHRINKGLFPKFRKDDIQNKKRDFYFIPEDDSEKLPQVIAGLVKKRLPSWGKFHPVRDIQVLCPMHKGSAGVLNLNAVLKQALNKNKGGLERGPITFDKGDKIMVTKNNYTKELFNGDLGTVIAVDTQNDRLTADFDGKIKVFERADLHQIELAYAISIHKSQGSEYPAVVIPVHTQHFIMLYRNLIYTAVTRAKKLAVLVGNTRGLSIAVKKNDTLVRYTMLESRIKNIKAHTQKH
jgi:exodeoxyribonuclease V alpha subunit